MEAFLVVYNFRKLTLYIPGIPTKRDSNGGNFEITFDQ
jgi:hypothetical protein